MSREGRRFLFSVAAKTSIILGLILLAGLLGKPLIIAFMVPYFGIDLYLGLTSFEWI